MGKEEHLISGLEYNSSPASYEASHAFSNTVTEAAYHDYGVYFTPDGKHKDLLICDSDSTKTPLYFAKMCYGGMRKPAVKLYAVRHNSLDAQVNMDGTKLRSKQAKTGKPLAVAHFPCFSCRIRMGFGNPEKPERFKWENMDRTKFGVSEFSMPLPKKEQYEQDFTNKNQEHTILINEGNKYHWHRTHSAADGLDNPAYARRLSMSNHKLLNEKGEIVALFISNGLQSCRKSGRLRIYRDRLAAASESPSSIDRETEIRIVLTYCAMTEKLRR